MDTNFSLNLFLVLVLVVLYCFRESDFKTDNFQNYSIDNFKETVKGEEERSDLKTKFKELEKYKNKPTPGLSKNYQNIQEQLLEAQSDADSQAQADLEKINLASGNNSKKKIKKNNNTIIKSSDDVVTIFNKKKASFTDSFVDTESLDSKQNNPPNNLPQPQNLNTTSYGLFNKHNLPPSSRPNVIDIFNTTKPSMESDIVQHSFDGNGNIFLPKVYV
jgi:hypothetical protein